jgi:hypothetical protein
LFRFSIGLAGAIAVATFGATPAVAESHGGLTQDLARLWTTVLETPSSQNPYLGDGCFSFGRTLVPFAATSVESCTVKPGTKLVLTGSSVECSSFDNDHGIFGTTPTELRRCAESSDAQTAPFIAVDGVQLRVNEVETGVLDIQLPADNLFGLPEGSTGRSVAHGWVAKVHPLPVGTHLVTITSADGSVISTTIIVRPTGQQP